MQQYRFNFPLFIALVVGTLVCSGAVYGVWRFQINRKSDWLLSEAVKSEEAKNFKEMVQYYQQYLTIHPGDENIRIKLAEASAERSKERGLPFEDLAQAIGVLEVAVRSGDLSARPEISGLRRRLVELYGREDINRYQDALEHLGYLLETDPTNPDLNALRATYLGRSGNFDEAVRLSYKLVGYDPEADEFDEKKATAPEEVDVYANLAGTLRARQDKPDLADRVMDQMVDVNPKSAKAHLARGRYQLLLGNEGEGRSEVEQAYRLATDDADVLLAIAELTAKDEEYDKALEYVAAGEKQFPKDSRFYSLAANILMRQAKYEDALAAVDKGIKNVEQNDQIQLRFEKIQLQLSKKDVKAAEQTLGDVKKLATQIRPEFIDLFQARILMEEGKWNAAKDLLNKVRPKFAEMPGGRAADVDYFLGLCYENLRQSDKAIEHYRNVLAQSPNNPPAEAGLLRASAAAGLETDNSKATPTQKQLAEELKKPQAERDWKKIEALVLESAKEYNLDELNTKVKLAQIRTMKEDYEGARKLLQEAQQLAPENIGVRRMQIQLTLLDPKFGPDRALELLQKTVAEQGDVPALRLDKADILIAKNQGNTDREELKADLAELFAGIDAWTPEQKTELWTGMANRYLNLGMNTEARQYLTLAANAQSHQLPLPLAMFSLALEANDDDGIKDAQDRILKIVGNKNDANWLYTEARRLLSLVRRNQLEPSSINQIRILVNRGLEQRPDWHELHVLNGELELQSGNLAKALEHFNRAQELGRPTPLATSQHIKILWLAGRVQQAGELLERIPEPMRYPLLGQLYPEILFRTNRVDEALKQAQAAIEANPNSAQNHYWYSQLLARSAQPRPVAKTAAIGTPEQAATTQLNKQTMAEAIKEMKRAVELQPEFPEAWLGLIAYYSQLDDEEQAQTVLRDAQLAISGDNLQIFLARSYEALRRWFDAETMYRAVYESSPDDLNRTQQLAAFYLGNVYPLPDKNAKATPLINKILRAGADKKLEPNDPTLLWARRMGAKMLAETGDYQSLIKAENLLASNSQQGELTIDDKLAMAEILASRPEPLSRRKAIELLEEVSSTQQLSERGEITLGALYYATNQDDWGRYSRQMRKAIARYPDSILARAAFVKNLIARGDKTSLDEATTHVKRMRQLNPKHIGTFEYTVRLADKLGRQQEARAELLRAVPDLSKATSLAPTDVQMLSMLANLLVELNDLNTAEKLYRQMAAIDLNQIPALANFLGNHRSMDQCFEKLNEIYAPERIPGILQVALVTVRKNREKVGDKFDAQVQGWLDTGLRENPDSIPLLMDQADFYDIQKKYKESAAIYRKLLERKDLVGIRRAILLNNLAFLVALDPQSDPSADPLELVNQAINIMGPSSDILDTRALVYISRKDYQKAINDLELAVSDGPTASKYFHKAQAHLMAGENRAALEAWEKAEELGLSHDAINLMEVKKFDDMKAKIDQIRSASVTQAEGRRRAG